MKILIGGWFICGFMGWLMVISKNILNRNKLTLADIMTIIPGVFIGPIILLVALLELTEDIVIWKKERK
jgi:hypothetical protein